MPVKTEAQQRAQENYMKKFARPYVRMKPEELQIVKAASAAAGESLNTFMLKAILQRVENEKSAEG